MIDRPRFVSARPFPSYAYLPGRYPHPVRDPGGHSHGHVAALVHQGSLIDSEEFLWGCDLFNHGFYWEAHEAWEGLWQLAEGDLRLFFKGMILLCAAGVKVREGKSVPALRHATRASVVFRLIGDPAQGGLSKAIGMLPCDVAMMSSRAIRTVPVEAHSSMIPEAVFPFVLRPGAGLVTPADRQ